MAKRIKKKWKIELTKRAAEILVDIELYNFITHSETRAEKIITSITNEFIKISERPFSYPVWRPPHGVADNNVRKATVHRTFQIIYEIITDRVVILIVFHGKQNPDKLKDIRE